MTDYLTCWPSRFSRPSQSPTSSVERATSDSEWEDMLMRAQTPSSADLDPLEVATASCNFCCKPPLVTTLSATTPSSFQLPTAVHRNRDLVGPEPQETPAHRHLTSLP